MLEKSKTPGAAEAILKDGKLIYQNAYGYRDLMTESLMKTDDIFKIYSMTKPITSAAIMMLWQHGLLKLSDPIHRYIPAFKNMTVAKENDAQTEIIDTVEAQNPLPFKTFLGILQGWAMAFLVSKPLLEKPTPPHK